MQQLNHGIPDGNARDDSNGAIHCSGDGNRYELLLKGSKQQRVLLLEYKI